MLTRFYYLPPCFLHPEKTNLLTSDKGVKADVTVRAKPARRRLAIQV